MSARQDLGVLPTRLAKFFAAENWWLRFSFGGLFIGHRRIGHFGIGSDVMSRRLFVISGGFGFRPDAPAGEICWRRHFRWAPDFPLLIYRYEPAWADLHGIASSAWTGREVRVIGWQWRGRVHIPWS